MTPSSLETVQDAFTSMCQQFETSFNTDFRASFNRHNNIRFLV